jgi:hypothetical protein
MAKHEVPDNNIGVYSQKLTANTVDEVDFFDSLAAIEVISDGTAKIYFTVDGSTPTVGGQNTHEIPAVASARTVLTRKGESGTVVKLISTGTPVYSVSRTEVDR